MPQMAAMRTGTHCNCEPRKWQRRRRAGTAFVNHSI
jgi:hypothetical protein